MIQHKNPVEESFIMWISMNPDSFHHLDMERFYIFVHSVIKYKAKSWRSLKKFKEKILFHNPEFPEEVIERYYDLMRCFIEFSKTSYLPSYENDRQKDLTIKIVKKGNIVTKTM